MHRVTLPKILQPFKCDQLIRLGKNNDGGYLVNSHDITKTKNFFSFGVGEDFSFEMDFLKKNKVPAKLYDSCLDQNKKHNDIVFHSKNIGNNSDDYPISKVFYNSDHIFLKCDIEGNEYQILDDIINFDDLYTGLIIEFHDVSLYKNFNLVTNFIGKTRLKLVHLHVNNYMYYKTNNGAMPDVLELTFSSSHNISYEKNLTLPNLLDMPNNPKDLEFSITF